VDRGIRTGSRRSNSIGFDSNRSFTEQISGNQLVLNQGALYQGLLKLEQAGWIDAVSRASESGRRVKVYGLTKMGRRQIRIEESDWQRSQGIVARLLNIQDDMP